MKKILGEYMNKKLFNYLFIASMIANASFTLAMEKEVQPKKEVASLTTLAARPFAAELWSSFKKDYDAFPLLQKLEILAKKLPREALTAILNFNLETIDRSAPRTFLIAALHPSQPSAYLIKRLIELGADVNIDDGYGRTPLNWAIFKFPESQEGIFVVRMIAKSSVNIDGMVEKGGKTILYEAVKKPKFLQILKDSGADITKSLFNHLQYILTEKDRNYYPQETFKLLEQARREKDLEKEKEKK